MRTLKKSLCFVLALVMVLGLFTVGANALYTDDAAINYTDAVTVLTGLGVIEGYPDSSFKPTAPVTRAEAAAMIARMMLGREDADKLPVGDVTFTDVAGTWAEAYIAFCANKGIIVGMGDGTFHPSENVTGAQLAAMLLRALGYGVLGEYEGKGWDINAVSDALLYKIFKDSEVTDFSAPATREETALYIFNTLFVQLVGYDVDLNYYDGLYRLADGKYVQVYFANSVFDLLKLEYVQVMENKYTGANYTVVRDDDGNLYNLAYETELGLIAHEATAYVRATTLDDKTNHCEYYETYLITDESTILDKGSYYDDFYRNLVAANKENKKGSFSEFVIWRNYVEQWTDVEVILTPETAVQLVNASGKVAGTVTIGGEEVEVDLELSDVVIRTGPEDEDEIVTLKKPVPVTMAYVTDYDFYKKFTTDEQIQYYWSGAYKNYQYYTFADLKGQMSDVYFGDYSYWISGTFVLDHEGKPLACLRSSYSIGIVKTVDASHEEVEVKVWNGASFDTDIYDMKFADIDLVYDGIAKGDYVVVQPQGELTLIKPTTTKEVDITRRSGSTFNNNLYQDGAYGIPIDDSDDYTGVNVGDKVLFYISVDYGFYAYYFGLQILEKAGLAGIVFVNYADCVMEHGDWGLVPTYKVQAINEEGEEVVFHVSEKEFNRMGGKNVTRGVYKAFVRASGLATFDNSDLYSEFTKTDGKNSFLKRDGGIYYVTSDTKVIYFSGVADELEIAVSSKLANRDDGQDYPVYATYTKSGGGYKLRTVWAPDQVAPEVFADSYMFIVGDTMGNYYKAPDAYISNGKTEVPVYDVYIDGELTEVQLTGAESLYYQDNVLAGFYQYSLDEDGVYHIVAARNVWTDTLEKGAVRNGKLYATYADGIEIKAGFVDVSEDTTIDTKKGTHIISAEKLEEMLTEGYTVTITYVYVTSGDDRVPAGVIYVTSVIDHPLAD